MNYDNVKRVLFILMFAGLMLYEVIYFLGVRRDYKCLVNIAKSEKVISEAKEYYHKGLVFLALGVTLCIYGICFFTSKLLNN